MLPEWWLSNSGQVAQREPEYSLDLTRFEHIDEAYMNELATCDFIKQRKNIVMIGNPGTGKTHLSIAL